MLIYCAGNMNAQVLAGMSERANMKNWLETNAHKGSRDCADWFATWECTDEFDNPVGGFRLFVDSGAFTAWVKGNPIDHDAYIAYAKQLQAKSVVPIVFASLDVIPGSLEGGPSTPEDFRAAATQGWANYQKEKLAGLETLPTFHQGDPWEFLDKMMAETNYIGLSPRKVGKTTQEKAGWLNDVFRHIDAAGKLPCEGNMHNALRTHGLGVSSPVFMESYPWYSVDSTCWLLGGRGYDLIFDGSRVLRLNFTEWGDKDKGRNISGNELHVQANMDTPHTLSAIHHYREAGKAKLVYYFHERGIAADAELNDYMTDHWAQRGVVWPDDHE